MERRASREEMLRRAALRAALAVSTLGGALAVGCATEEPPDDPLVQADAQADGTASADGAIDAADTGRTDDATGPQDVEVDSGDAADGEEVAEGTCGEADGVCPASCGTSGACGDPDCCEGLEGYWTIESWGACSDCPGVFCHEQACCDAYECGTFVLHAYGYCAAGGCPVPGPFRPPAVRV